jgi:hypothetical protein
VQTLRWLMHTIQTCNLSLRRDDEHPAGAVGRKGRRSRHVLRGGVSNEHGWLLGRIVDPFGHEWEIGVHLEAWPPN